VIQVFQLKLKQSRLTRLVPALDWLRHYERQSLSKSGPLFAVIVGTAIVAAFGLGETSGVNIVGEIPRGLPKLAFPELGGFRQRSGAN
jgi:MFS superfamily sulfate permease-like transporter